MKILLLEDNERLSNLIIETLEEKSYHIDWFKDGKEALEAIYNGYDCFILDINVPRLDGLSLLKEIKIMDTETPSIIISANVELDAIQYAYTNGCDEYIKKPFYIYELEKKLDKLCKKRDTKIKLVSSYSFDTKSELLFDEENKEVKLAKKEINMFNLFAKNINKIVTYEQIEQYVWEGEVTSNDNIRALMKRMRKKLPQNAIDSKSGVGYRLVISK